MGIRSLLTSDPEMAVIGGVYGTVFLGLAVAGGIMIASAPSVKQTIIAEKFVDGHVAMQVLGPGFTGTPLVVQDHLAQYVMLRKSDDGQRGKPHLVDAMAIEKNGTVDRLDGYEM